MAVSQRPARPPIPAATRRALALAYGCQPGQTITVPCHYCGLPGTVYWPMLHRKNRPGGWVAFGHHIDHVTPYSQGGTHDVGNLVLACACCNMRRGADRPSFRPWNAVTAVGA